LKNRHFLPFAGALWVLLLHVPLLGFDTIKVDGRAVTWRDGTVTLRVMVDNSSHANAVRAAMDAWNAVTGRVQFAERREAGGAGGDGNGVNEVLFASDIMGDAFGENVLAVATTYYYAQPRSDNTYPRAESDIVFNTAYTWDVYGGSLRSTQDVGRVALHELGHALGLDHPDQASPPQSVSAIMNSHVSNLDSLAEDDRQGARWLYGSETSLVRPSNDRFASAISVAGSTVQVTGSNVSASKEHNEPFHGPDEPGGASVWWKWTAPASGSVTVTTAGSSMDTLLAAYTGSSVESLHQLASNDDVQSGVVSTSAITFPVTGGTTYHLAVDGWDGASGDIRMNLDLNATPPANRPPSGSFTLSSHRQVGQTLTLQIDLADPDGNYAFANLWIYSPSRGWLTLRADNSLVQSGSLLAANSVATTTGSFQRSFSFSPIDGPGNYIIGLAVVDALGERYDAPAQTITVVPAVNTPPTASFSLSTERTMGQTITATLQLGDAEGNFSYANLWVHTPRRGWLSIKADNSVVVSGALSAANAVASSAGTHVRTFSFTATDGPGLYTFGLAAVDAAGARTDATAQSINVLEPAISLPTGTLDLAVPAGYNHLPLRLPVTRGAGVSTSGFTVSSTASWVEPAFDGNSSELVLNFSTAGLVAASSSATVRINKDGQAIDLVVRALVSPVQVTKLIDDPARSRVYGVHQNGVGLGALVVFDPLAGSEIGALTLGARPGDIAVRPDGSELIALCSVTKTIVVVDLATLQVTETIPLDTYDDWGPAETWGDIGYGPGNVIYYTDGTWAPVMRVFDRSSKTVLQSIMLNGAAPNNSGGYGFGDFATNADGTMLYAWGQYGWSAGLAGSAVARIPIDAAGRLGTPQVNTAFTYPTFTRDPLNTPVLVANGSGDVFIKQLRFPGGSFSASVQTFPSNIFAISPGGEIATTSTGIFEVSTGNRLYSLSGSPSVQVITSDYARLVYFDSTTRRLRTVDLFSAIGGSIMQRNLAPANGAIVTPPSSLQWTPQPGVDRYRIYLGTDSAAVAAAQGTSSPLYLGESSLPSFTLNTLPSPGQVYYWRVDPITAAGSSPGPIFSFRVATLATSQSKIETATVQGHARHRATLHLSSATEGKAWNARSSASWISFAASSGTTPSALTVQFDASALTAGVHQAAITLTANDGAFEVPVSLTVDPLAITVMNSVPNSTKIYALSEENAAAFNGTSRAYLIELDALFRRIDRVVRVGTAATDLAVHVPDNRIYVANWKAGSLLAINRTTFALERTFGFQPAQSMGYTENDVYRLSAGSAGRLMVIQQDQWINVQIFDTNEGRVAATSTALSLYAGDGAYDPAGRYYYHGDSGYTGAVLHKVDTAGDQFTAHQTTSVYGAGYYGAADLVMSESGDRLFWNGSVIRPDLSVEWGLGARIVSASRDGRYAFGTSAIYDVENRSVIANLPVTANISAFNTATATLVYPASTGFGFFELPQAALPFAPADGAGLTGAPTLSWSAIPGAVAYRVYVGTDRAAVAAADPSSPEFQGETAETTFTVPPGLANGRYYWRVDVRVAGEDARGAVREFSLGSIVANRARLEGYTVQGNPNYEFELEISGVGAGLAWSASSSAPWVQLTPSGGVTPATLRVRIDTTALPPGLNRTSVTLAGSNGPAVEIPVSIFVDSLALTVLKSDPASAKVYAISEEQVEGLPGRAYLLEIDAQTQRILRTVRAGSGVTDLTLHSAEGRVYVTNWREGSLLAFDRSSLALVRSHPFRPFSYSGAGGGDVYRVAAGVAGRLVVEEFDQWIDIGIYDTTTSTMLGTAFVREGGGQFERTGRYYYHGENNSSGAMLRKYDTAGDVFAPMTAVRTESASYYGSRTVVVSEDGNRIFWNGGVFDPSLNVLWTTGAEVFSSSSDGRYVFGQDKVFDTIERRVAYAMPTSTKVSAFNTTSGKLVVQVGGRLAFLSLAELPGLNARPSIITHPTAVLAGGGGATFEVGAIGTAPLAYQWQRLPAGTGTWLNVTNSGVYSGAQSYRLRLSAVSPGFNQDRFRCVVSNSFGVVTSNEATLQVSPNRPPVASFVLSSARQIGETLTIAVNVDDPDGNYAYANLWIYSPNRGWLTLKADNSVVQSGSLLAGNTVAASAGTHTRTFQFTPTDGAGVYRIGMSAVDSAGARTDVASQVIEVRVANRPPSASFSLSSAREMGETLTITVNVDDPDGNYAYANLWIYSPNRGWLTLKADNSVVQSGSLLAGNTVATSAGPHTRTFQFTPTDGAGVYRIGMSAVDTEGARTDVASQTIEVRPANRAPTASFTLSPHRQIGETLTITVNVDDPDGNYAYANLWIHSPNRGWLTLKADNSVVQSGSLLAGNTVATSAGTHTRTFQFTPTDGAGVYRIGMSAVDSAGARTDVASQVIEVRVANRPPSASFSLSSAREMGETLTITVNVDDPDGNYAYANLWIHSPNRGWLTLKADNSVVQSGSLLAGNTVATSAGTHTRTFQLTPTDGAGVYRIGMSAVDTEGARTDVASQMIEVRAANQPPTASFNLSSERTLGETLTITVNVGDPDGNYAYANLWIRTPNRGWITVKADNSVVVSGALDAANTVAGAAGTHTRTFQFTPTDGAGVYRVGLSAVDSAGARTDVPTQSFTVSEPAGNQPPTASFSISSERTLGETLTITVNVGDPDGNYAYANLWIRTPNRGWITVKADNSVVVSGALDAANTVAGAAGTHTRTFQFTPTDGAGVYRVGLSAVDSAGARTDVPTQSFTVSEPAGNQPPTASFSISSERTLGETLTITVNVGDPDGNYAYANLWIRTPNRGWITVKADNSVVVSGALDAANTVAGAAGTHTRMFQFTPTDGTGVYRVGLSAVDSAGARTDVPTQSFTVSVSSGLSNPATLGGIRYSDWAQLHFSPAELADSEVSGPDAVTGEDGVTNLLRYALGLGRDTPVTASLPQTTSLNEHWFYTYHRPVNVTDVVYRVEASTDLTNWSDLGVTQEIILGSAVWQTWQAHYHGVAGQTVYFRLNLSLR
jgi:hypothetical protein